MTENSIPHGVWYRCVPVLVLALALLALLSIVFDGWSLAEVTDDPTVVRCEPLIATGPATATLSIDLYVQNAVNLYGADIRVTFDTVAAHVIDADPNVPGVQIQPLFGFLSPDLVIRRDADNNSGLIWYAVTQLNPSPPVTGSGALARVTFQPQSTAAFTMPVINYQLAGPGGVPLPSVSQSCMVVFQPCYDVNADGIVDVQDIIAEADRWTLTAVDPDPDNDPFTPNYASLYDLNDDGVIDVIDIMLTSSHWLQQC
ncbi:MAG: hypothetical protein KDI03_06445 [Anaerolineae bacterium]|nr:hypothetical protein [Anaerolineae bacterium]